MLDSYDQNNLDQRGELLTERSNLRSHNLDTLSTIDLVKIFSEEDKEPQKAVARSIPQITNAIESILIKLKEGGRLFYVGAGTSGRLGVLDAAECPPTFCTSPELIQGIIAGGQSALTKSSEGLEDSENLAINDLKLSNITNADCIVGISAGGTTRYVNSALSFANTLGSLTVSIACVPTEQVRMTSDIDIRLLTGPELLTGSTRLKAGTATKMLLNMISTIIMIRMGKVYGNKMIDLSISNNKLKDRALRILSEVGNINRSKGEKLLEITNGSVKVALLMELGTVDVIKAKSLLDKSNQNLRKALKRCL